ncbi:unnamed protein product [Chrysoparadoxa australica]
MSGVEVYARLKQSGSVWCEQDLMCDEKVQAGAVDAYMARARSDAVGWARSDGVGKGEALMKLHLACASDSGRVTLRAEVELPGMAWKLTSIPPLPLLRTPLVVDLLGKASTKASAGHVSLNEARRAVLLMGNDPLASRLPLVGVWVTGCRDVKHPLVLSACSNFVLRSSTVQRVCSRDRTCDRARALDQGSLKPSDEGAVARFLLLLLQPQRALPVCYEVEASTGTKDSAIAFEQLDFAAEVDTANTDSELAVVGHFRPVSNPAFRRTLGYCAMPQTGNQESPSPTAGPQGAKLPQQSPQAPMALESGAAPSPSTSVPEPLPQSPLLPPPQPHPQPQPLPQPQPAVKSYVPQEQARQELPEVTAIQQVAMADEVSLLEGLDLRELTPVAKRVFLAQQRQLVALQVQVQQLQKAQVQLLSHAKTRAVVLTSPSTKVSSPMHQLQHAHSHDQRYDTSFVLAAAPTAKEAAQSTDNACEAKGRTACDSEVTSMEATGYGPGLWLAGKLSHLEEEDGERETCTGSEVPVVGRGGGVAGSNSDEEQTGPSCSVETSDETSINGHCSAAKASFSREVIRDDSDVGAESSVNGDDTDEGQEETSRSSALVAAFIAEAEAEAAFEKAQAVAVTGNNEALRAEKATESAGKESKSPEASSFRQNKMHKGRDAEAQDAKKPRAMLIAADAGDGEKDSLLQLAVKSAAVMPLHGVSNQMLMEPAAMPAPAHDSSEMGKKACQGARPGAAGAGEECAYLLAREDSCRSSILQEGNATMLSSSSDDPSWSVVCAAASAAATSTAASSTRSDSGAFTGIEQMSTHQQLPIEDDCVSDPLLQKTLELVAQVPTISWPMQNLEVSGAGKWGSSDGEGDTIAQIEAKYLKQSKHPRGGARAPERFLLGSRHYSDLCIDPRSRNLPKLI